MRFLGLTSLQALVLAILTTAAIVALYFLKHKRRRFVVSSSLLWRRVLENQLENSLFEKLRRLVSILVAVATALLVALAIARPQIDWLTGKPHRSVIVLDTSASMQARTPGGATRWERAVEAARSLAEESSIGNEFRVADTSGQFDSPYTADPAELRRLIDRMHPVIGPTVFPEVDKAPSADSDTAEPEASPDTKVYFITDGVAPVKPPADAVFISVFEAAPNVGITAFEIRSMPSAKLAYEAYLEVYNSGKEAREAEITVAGAGQQRIAKSVKIQPGKSYREALDLSQFEGGGIRAAVRSDGDAFSPDDVAYAYLPVKKQAKTLLVTAGNKFLENVLKLDSLVDLSVVDPSGYAPGEYDAYVFDRFVPPERPTRPSLIIGSREGAWLRPSLGTVANPGFRSWMEDHPVMRFVSLHDVSVNRASRIDASTLTVLASSGPDSPLIVASDRPRWIWLTFDLQSSDFAYHPAFPLFVDNALAWFDRERLALPKPPGVVDIPMAQAQVRTMDGQAVASHEHLGGTTFEAAEPGLYVVSQGDERQYVAVNFANRMASNINNSSGHEGHESAAEAPLLRRELWVYMLAAAMVLMAAEWFTYHRRITL